MASDPKEKLAALNTELEQIVKNYNQATQVVENCRQRIFELKGGIAALQELVHEEVAE